MVNKAYARVVMTFILLMIFGHIDLLEGFVGIPSLSRLSSIARDQESKATDTTGLGTQMRATLTSRPPSIDFNPPQKRQTMRMPTLTNKEKLDLLMGKRIQKQHRLGRAGYGLVVLDVTAPIDDVFSTLSSFQMYQEMIPTVKSVNVYSTNDTNCAAEFCLSRFRLRMNVIHHLNQQQRSIRFTLDANRINPILKFVDGLWTLEDVSSSDSIPSSASQLSRTRIYFNIELEASRLVPSMVVDYAASRALPKATAWLQPHFVHKYQTLDTQANAASSKLEQEWS